VGDDTIVFALDGVIDLDAERSRITKVIEAATKERDALASRLSNAAFLASGSSTGEAIASLNSGEPFQISST
jgi:valyl-tRNA synthetase